jgi:hypothetical protein
MNDAKVEQRIRLIPISRADANVKPGDTDIVWHEVQSNGIRYVRCDSGAKVDLDPKHDKCEILDEHNERRDFSRGGSPWIE